MTMFLSILSNDIEEFNHLNNVLQNRLQGHGQNEKIFLNKAIKNITFFINSYEK